MKSRDDVQLLADADDLVKTHQDCDPYDKIDKDGAKLSIAPCGAIANSLFNDTFFLVKCPDTGCTTTNPYTDAELRNPINIPERLPMTGLDIAWSTDKVYLLVFI